MKVSVRIDGKMITTGEANVVDHLCDSLRRDIELLKCDYCAPESEVILHVNTSKFSVFRTEVKACCRNFHSAIEKAMLVEA